MRPQSGDILLDGKSIVQLKQYERVRSGIVRTFQISRLFKELTSRKSSRWRYSNDFALDAVVALAFAVRSRP